MSANPHTPAGVIHLHRGIASSDRPLPVRFEPTKPPLRFWSGAAIGLLLVAPIWYAVWLCWPVIWAVLRVVGL